MTEQKMILMADGKKMAVDGVAYIFCKPDGCSFYKLIRFIVSPTATEVWISFRDQQTLNVLPKNYITTQSLIYPFL